MVPWNNICLGHEFFLVTLLCGICVRVFNIVSFFFSDTLVWRIHYTGLAGLAALAHLNEGLCLSKAPRVRHGSNPMIFYLRTPKCSNLKYTPSGQYETHSTTYSEAYTKRIGVSIPIESALLCTLHGMTGIAPNMQLTATDHIPNLPSARTHWTEY